MLDHPLVRRLAGVAAWSAVAILAVLSLLPKDDMVRTGVDGRLEHLVAYAGTTALWALAHGRRFGSTRIAVGLILYAAALELGQHFALGRTPALADFGAGAAGVVAVALGYAAVTRR